MQVYHSPQNRINDCKLTISNINQSTFETVGYLRGFLYSF